MNGHAPARSVALSVRLWTSDSSGGKAAVSFTADSPATALAIDVIAASGGASGSAQGVSLTARFLNLQSALLAARRLQWALEGLAQSSPASAAASVAIHPFEDGLQESGASSALDTAAPGKVLLANRFIDLVRQLPGLAVSPAAGNWCELGWRAPAEPSSLDADEQSVLGLIRALGREDPLASPAAQAVPTPQPVPAVTTGSHDTPTGLGRSVLGEEPPPQPLWKKPWVMLSAGAAVLVIVAILVIRGMSPAPQPEVAAPQPSPKTPAPTASSTTTSAPIASEKPPAAKPPVKAARPPRSVVPEAPKTEAQTETPKPPPAPASSCDLTETEIPLSLQRAARLMSAGKLPEARDAYQRLVGCPSAHDKAVEGLRLVKQRMDFQGTPN